LWRRSDSATESGHRGPLGGSRALSETTRLAGSARSPSQTALHRYLPGGRICGTAVGADFWFLANMPVGFALAGGGTGLLQASVEGARLLRYSPPAHTSRRDRV